MNNEIPHDEVLTMLADFYKVFGDFTRVKIMFTLMGKELCVQDIAEAVNASQSAVSHQLRTLKQVSLVKYRREGKSILYSLSDDHIATILSQGLEHVEE